MRTSRRTFLKTGVVAAGTALVPRSVRSATTKNPIVPPLSQFGYADVQLLDGPMLEQFRRNHSLFLALDEDKLLKPFRQAAGLPTPGEDMGGWYTASKDFDPPRNFSGFIPGQLSVNICPD
jgi:hypothetical protein